MRMVHNSWGNSPATKAIIETTMDCPLQNHDFKLVDSEAIANQVNYTKDPTARRRCGRPEKRILSTAVC
jgi:hypothetical protein